MLATPQLQAGLVCGLLAAALVAALAVDPSVRSRRPIPVADVALTLATLGALFLTRGLAPPLLAGIAALLLGGALIAWRRPPPVFRTLILLPGALLVVAAWSGLPELSWPRVLGVAAIAGGGALATSFAATDARLASSPGLALGTTLGVFLTVPDTEEALVLLGAALPVALLGWPLRQARFGPLGTAAWVALMVWTTLTGGVGRPASIVGGLGCLGVFVLMPAVVGVARRASERTGTDLPGAMPHALADPASTTTLPATWRSVASVVAVHAAYVLIASRGAGLRQSLTEASLILLLATATASGWIVVELKAIRRRAAEGRSETV